MLRNLRELIRYRTLLRFMVVQDLTVRYRSSFLGFLWTLLNPLLLMLVMWVVFSRFGRIEEENYVLFLLSGLMTWLFFSQSIERGQDSIIRHRGLIQQIYLPKLIFPVAVVTSNILNLFFFFLAYLIIAIASGYGIALTTLAIPPALMLLYLIAAGGAILMCSLNVFFRDFTHLTAVFLRALFYLTPVIYPPRIMGEKAQMILKFNPLYYPVTMIRDLIYYGKIPPPGHWIVGSVAAVIVMLVGLWVFSSNEERFVYYA